MYISIRLDVTSQESNLHKFSDFHGREQIVALWVLLPCVHRTEKRNRRKEKLRMKEIKKNETIKKKLKIEAQKKVR
jgi:hypothetical protein